VTGGQFSFTTGAIATALGAQLAGRDDLPINSLDPLDRAGPQSLTFIRSAEYAGRWAGCHAAAALVSRGIEVAGHDPGTRALLVVDDADMALVRLLELAAEQSVASRPAPGVHASAVVDAAASVAPGAHIGPGCVVEAGAAIGEGAVLVAQVFVGRGARIGAGVTLHPGVRVLERCELGDGTIVHAGSVIGADGFGYRPAPDGSGLVKIPHIGTVRIGRDVEIGACSCVDRGKLGATTIGDGTKIDNLVQIAHNCQIGRSVIICGQSGLSGSVTVGDGAVLAGGVSVADNLTIGAGARLGGRAGVMHNVPAGEAWLGAPAQNIREETQNMVVQRRLARTVRELRAAIRRLEPEK
jgi:UDP-3-O-[3-hydroxymyristoyl] glucosamine N-acyltransferase